MKRRPPPAPSSEGVPAELFEGVWTDGYRKSPPDAPMTAVELGRRRREWLAAVRAAGFTLDDPGTGRPGRSIWTEVEDDPEYRTWRFRRDRRVRLLLDDLS